MTLAERLQRTDRLGAHLHLTLGERIRCRGASLDSSPFVHIDFPERRGASRIRARCRGIQVSEHPILQDHAGHDEMRNAAGAIGTARANGKGRLVLWATLIVGVLALARNLNAQALLQDALRWIQGLGPIGWVIFVLLYIAATVLLLPAVVLTLGAGAIFGILKGWIIVSTAATLGATGAFLIGRYFARGWVARRIEANQTFLAMKGGGREGWRSSD